MDTVRQPGHCGLRLNYVRCLGAVGAAGIAQALHATLDLINSRHVRRRRDNDINQVAAFPGPGVAVYGHPIWVRACQGFKIAYCVGVPGDALSGCMSGYLLNSRHSRIVIGVRPEFEIFLRGDACREQGRGKEGDKSHLDSPESVFCYGATLLAWPETFEPAAYNHQSGRSFRGK